MFGRIRRSRLLNPDVYLPLVYILTITTLVFVLFVSVSREFMSTDPELTINYILPSQQKSVNFALVTTGFIVTDMSKMNARKNEFELAAIIWFVFDPSKISLDTIGKFSFENGSIINKADPVTELRGNNTLAKYSVVVKFSTPLNYKLHPIDDHRISLVLINRSVSPDEMIYQANESDFVFAPHILPPGWRYWGKKVEYGYSKVSLNDSQQIAYPIVIFSFDFKKISFGSILTVVVPMLIIFFIALICFSLARPASGNTGITLSISNLAALIGYRFVLQGLLPRVGYLTLTDYIFGYVFIVGFIAFIINFFVFRTQQVPHWFEKFCVIMVRLFCVLFIVLIYVMLYLFPKG